MVPFKYVAMVAVYQMFSVTDSFVNLLNFDVTIDIICDFSTVIAIVEVTDMVTYLLICLTCYNFSFIEYIGFIMS